MYFITTKRMLEVCFFQHTPTFIIEPFYYIDQLPEDQSQSQRFCYRFPQLDRERSFSPSIVQFLHIETEDEKAGYRDVSDLFCACAQKRRQKDRTRKISPGPRVQLEFLI